jgi:hypothetical protein
MLEILEIGLLVLFFVGLAVYMGVNMIGGIKQ